MKGLCIIPEGRRNMGSKDIGYPYEVTNIIYLDEILEYSRKNRLGVLYLCNKAGISYSDDVIEYEPLPLYRLDRASFRKWSMIISEQIIRECLKYSTLNVYIMCQTGNYMMIKAILESRGINVYAPLLGVRGSIREKLSSNKEV